MKADTLELDSRERFEDTEKSYGNRWAMFHRADLHTGLRDLVEHVSDPDGSRAKIELASEVVKVDPEQGILTMADGSIVQKDLLVIADGAHVGSHSCADR